MKIEEAIQVLREAGFRAVQGAGWHFQRKEYYSALNDATFLEANRDLWVGAIEPPGIDWNLGRQLEVAQEVSRFVPELRDVPEESSPPGVYSWRNQFWVAEDAIVQYGLVRSRHPRRYVEIGCGWSSLMLKRALERNEPEGGGPCEVTLIDPFPRRPIFDSLPPQWRRHEVMLQRAPMSIFESLEAGDFLFYDGSHCAKVAGDVNWFFFRVLPRVKPGVLIHVHDIFLPREYPESWFLERGQTWNEQYLVQAFLMHNERYRVEIANAYLREYARDDVERLYGGIQPLSGASLWMRKLE